jgi:hypothetical protein
MCRWTWKRGVVGDGAGYSVKLSIGVWPVLGRWSRTRVWGQITELDATILGLRFHYQRSYGGIHAS